MESPPGWTIRGTVGVFFLHCTSPGASLEMQKGLLCALLLFVNLNWTCNLGCQPPQNFVLSSLDPIALVVLVWKLRNTTNHVLKAEWRIFPWCLCSYIVLKKRPQRLCSCMAHKKKSFQENLKYKVSLDTSKLELSIFWYGTPQRSPCMLGPNAHGAYPTRGLFGTSVLAVTFVRNSPFCQFCRQEVCFLGSYGIFQCTDSS